MTKGQNFLWKADWEIMKGILCVIEILKPPVLLFIAGLASPAVPQLIAILSPAELAPLAAYRPDSMQIMMLP